MSDPELEAVFRRIADRSMPRVEKAPALRPPQLSRIVSDCAKHSKIVWGCSACETSYKREWRRRQAAAKRKEKS